MIAADQFHCKYALESTINQLQPQKISSNVWLGPLNSVAQTQFLNANNIKYIIGILPTQKCCYYLKDCPTNEFCCISIDPNFSLQKLNEDEAALVMDFNTKFTPSVGYLTDNQVTNAIITNISYQKILDDFVVIMKSIQEKDPGCGVLLFSLNGNDNMLSSFALAYIQDAMNSDIDASFQYLKSIRPTVWDYDEMGFFLNELVKYHITSKARRQFSDLPTLKVKRSAYDLLDCHEVDTEAPRNRKRMM